MQSKVPVREDKVGYDLSVCYSPGVAEPGKEIAEDQDKVYKYTNKGNLIAVISDGTRVLGLIPGPGVISKEEISVMADDAIVFPCANPLPEILPEDAKEAGTRIVATGRREYLNQINNSLGFPAVFRGALDVHVSNITDKMRIAAAKAIAERVEEIGLSEDFVVPTMKDTEMYAQEAMAVAKKAMEQGVARRELPED